MKGETCPRRTATSCPRPASDWLLPLYDPFTRLIGSAVVAAPSRRAGGARAGQRVLDLGCGTGATEPDRGARAAGPRDRRLSIPTRRRWRARAARRSAPAWRSSCDRASATRCRFADASFDRVLSSFMFHHLESDQKPAVLREVRRVLRPGGSLHLRRLRRRGSRAGRLPRAARAPRGEPAGERRGRPHHPDARRRLRRCRRDRAAAIPVGSALLLPRGPSWRGLTGLCTGPQALQQERYLPPRSSERRLSQGVGNPLEWSVVERSRLMILLTLPFYVVLRPARGVPDRPSRDRAVLRPGLARRHARRDRRAGGVLGRVPALWTRSPAGARARARRTCSSRPSRGGSARRESPTGSDR